MGQHRQIHDYSLKSGEIIILITRRNDVEIWFIWMIVTDFVLHHHICFGVADNWFSDQLNNQRFNEFINQRKFTQKNQFHFTEIFTYKFKKQTRASLSKPCMSHAVLSSYHVLNKKCMKHQ